MAEAVNNIIIHGYDFRPGGFIGARVSAEPGRAEVVLIDGGRAIPPERLAACDEVAPDAECGRGMNIIRACVSRLDYRSVDGRNELSLIRTA